MGRRKLIYQLVPGLISGGRVGIGKVKFDSCAKKEKNEEKERKKLGCVSRAILPEVHIYALRVHDWPWFCSIGYAADWRLSILHTTDKGVNWSWNCCPSDQ